MKIKIQINQLVIDIPEFLSHSYETRHTVGTEFYVAMTDKNFKALLNSLSKTLNEMK